MSTKLKALGLGLVATMAVGAFAAVNVSATVTGHFTSDLIHTTVKGVESGSTHRLSFVRSNASTTPLGAPIFCDVASYEGTTTAATVTQVTITPKYAECHTENEPAGTVGVTTNGCTYTVFSRSLGHGTTAVDCPVGQNIVIHHPNCTMTVPPQSGAHMKGGITYTTTVEETKHALTANVTVSHITVYFHGGLCIMFGTNQLFELKGSVTAWGQSAAGVRTNITHT